MTARRWIALALFAVLAAVGGTRLRLDTDVLGLLPGNLPEVRGLAAYQRHFASGRQLFVTVSATNAATAADAARSIASALRAKPGLVRSADWQAPWLENPGDLPELLAWLWLNRPPEEFAAMASNLAPGALDATFARARETLASSLSPADLARVANDPLGLSAPGASGPPAWAMTDGGFASADGTFRVVTVEPPESASGYRGAAPWLESVRAAVVAAMPPGGGTRVRFTGGPAFATEIAAGMQSDFGSSVATTAAVIAGLFWLAHRSWRPLLRLVAMLGLTLAVALLAGGALFGGLNVVGLGFAAVLLGLVVDYGLVTYQERVASPDVPPARLRRELAPALGWAAATTAGTFLALAAAGLPGLAQLGVLVAVGIVAGAGIMLWQFSAPLPAAALAAARAHPAADPRPVAWYGPAAAVATAALLAAATSVLVASGPPALVTSAEPLRPRRSEAYDAMEELSRRLARASDPAWVVVAAPDAPMLDARLAAVRSRLEAARAAGIVADATLPVDLVPHGTWALTNRLAAFELAERAGDIRDAAFAAGFTTNALRLSEGVLRAWRGASGGDPWPTNATARWILRQAMARDEDGRGLLALGLVRFASDAPPRALATALESDGGWLTGWTMLGPALLSTVRPRVAWLTAAVAVVLAGSLALTFRRAREVFLGLAALAFSGTLVLAAMRVAGWSWNLMSLVAVPLLLGTSVDSTIHVMLSLRRHGGDLRAVWRTTGRALLLCAGANLAGFGSLAFSSNAGLASLDLVCALGVTAVFFVSLALLPAWWLASGGAPGPRGTASRLYGVGAWRAASWVGRALPRGVLGGMAACGAVAYAAARPSRRAVVASNLAPWCAGGPREARRRAWANFAAFGRKLADLWRYESGADVSALVRPGAGWPAPDAFRVPGRGVLLVTVHLGNWEFGAPLLASSGERLLVLTAPEPGDGLTELRRAARERRGIRTLVVGDDPFAFVEVIKWLGDGGTAALLLDRPPAGRAAAVEWCGRPFLASPAAAELARATGCAVVPVVLPRVGDAYEARMLGEVAYDRAALGDRAARVEFTGRILRAFEPSVREFPEQWFHFVPAWPPA